MTPTHSTRDGTKRYRYYVCSSAQENGRATCPSKSVSAGPLEEFVVERIRCVGRDPDLLREVLAQARAKDETHTAALEAEAKGLEKDLKSWHGEVRRLSVQLVPGEDNAQLVGRLADLHERIARAEGQARRVRADIAAATARLIPEDEAARALAAFDPVWQNLTPREQGRVIELLVERVDYDGGAGTVAVTFRPTGIKTLADELAHEQLEQPPGKWA